MSASRVWNSGIRFLGKWALLTVKFASLIKEMICLLRAIKYGPTMYESGGVFNSLYPG